MGEWVRLQSYACNGGGAQSFQLNARGSGQWEIRRTGTNLCIDVELALFYSGAIVQQFTCNDTLAQRFAIEARPGGVQLRVAGTNLCIDVTDNRNDSGAPLQLGTCDNSDAQVFNPLAPHLRKINGAELPMVEDGAVLCVDAPGNSLSAGLRLQTWMCNGGSGQNWQFNAKGYGLFEIRRHTTGLCFDVPAGIARTGSPVTQYPCNDNPAQVWAVEGRGRGAQIRYSGSDLCVDISENSEDTGAKLQLWPCNGNNAQIFGL
jgi:hypothetical protein